ncbi:MAG: sigma-54-dependent transcriptional regulator [Bacteriovoracaceae bacterium]
MDDLNFLHQTYDNSHKTRLPKVVLVEDDESLGPTIKKFLEKKFKTEVIYFNSATSCLMDLKNDFVDGPFLLLTDISLEQGTDGLLLIDVLKDRGFVFTSIVMTGFASIESAIAATKKGVFHYLTKPFDLENLYQLLKGAMEEKFHISFEELEKEAAALTSFSSSNAQKATNAHAIFTGKFKIELPLKSDIFCGILGRSQKMKDVFERIMKVAASDSTVLITGASGTGKELVANAIHSLSARAKQNKVSVNCGAIPSELLESELFGHMKGSFTGAISNRKGRFEIADKGSIFLDEIGDMPLQLQVKILRVLQQKQIEPVGGNRTQDIDVRIITATHRDLDKLVAEGKFREDLFYRLNVIPIKMPALKERREDIPLLIGHFLSRFISADGSNQISFSDEALEMVMSYDWPGNVRELENVIERLVILRGGNVILPEDLPARLYTTNPLATKNYKNIFELPEVGVDLRQILTDIEDSLIAQALGKTDGNKNQASKLLNINRTTLIEKMKKKGMTL